MALTTDRETVGCYGRECAGSDGERVGGMCLFSIPKGKNVFVVAIG